MIKNEYQGKEIKITDIDGKIWQGKAAMITPAKDSDSGENEIAIEFGGGLTEFREGEIVAIMPSTMRKQVSEMTVFYDQGDNKRMYFKHNSHVTPEEELDMILEKLKRAKCKISAKKEIGLSDNYTSEYKGIKFYIVLSQDEAFIYQPQGECGTLEELFQ